MTSKVLILIVIINSIFVLNTNKLMAKNNLKIIVQEWYSFPIVPLSYEEFLKNELHNFNTTINYGNERFIADFRNFINAFQKQATIIINNELNKNNIEIRLVAILSYENSIDTISVDMFKKFILINSVFYKFEYSLLLFLKYKLPFFSVYHFDEMYLDFYNNKREDQ